MASNFAFLEKRFPELADFGEKAERYVYNDPSTAIWKLGLIGETVVNLSYQYDHIPLPLENTAVQRIRVLDKEGMLSTDLVDILHALRKARNDAAHEGKGSTDKAKALLQMAFGLCEWFMQTYGDWNYQNQRFVMPSQQAEIIHLDRKAEETKDNQLAKKAEKRAAENTETVAKEKRKVQAGKAAKQYKKPEDVARYLIDQALRDAGWEVDTAELRHSKGTRPMKGHNMAIAEWPTGSDKTYKGFADYALFLGTRLVGVVEAKAIHKDVSSVIDHQCKDYARHICDKDTTYRIGTWGKDDNTYSVPFVFAANGRPYIKQYEEKSGIWFLDLRKPDNTAYALKGWPSPEGIEAMLERNKEEENHALETMPYDFLTDPHGLSLRYYQVEAIEAAEKAIMAGQKDILLAMATGTGKTRTILGMMYRFLKSKRFRRILYLVDRIDLGEQAEGVFASVKLEDLLTLNKIYNVNGLKDKVLDKETSVQVATVNSMMNRILYSEGADDAKYKKPAVTDFDLIIVDEAHRGYILDKDMDDDELLYRSQLDYQGKYRAVIEYFDAVKIGLTATPALQTKEIFGAPVYTYSYRDGVIDGYLVDHDAPHILKTKLSTEGIHFQKGDDLTLYDPDTGDIVHTELMDDEMDFDVDDFNRKVITESFNRTVLTEIAKDIDPEGDGKTLIFAVKDDHADLIVRILREIYAESGVPNDAIMKITDKAGEGNQKKVREAVKRFKNERFPSIAVTVDLLTTGIDVPEIVNLVFLRCVRSRILFEQMLGRATRLCPAIHKTKFDIYDPVGVYDALQPVSTMKPVAANPKTDFSHLLDGLSVLKETKRIQRQIDQVIARIQRKKEAMDETDRKSFEDLSGGVSPDGFIHSIREVPVTEAKDRILSFRPLFTMLDKVHRKTDKAVIISDKEDVLLEHSRGYGSGITPRDYLDEFAEYIRGNMNTIAALQILCTRPASLDRASLQSLRRTLDREGFTEQQLNTAISELSNKDITADIITIIRKYAIGSPLISHEERIKRAVDKLKEGHTFTQMEINWLDKIEAYLMNESVMSVDTFDEDSRFRGKGGFKRIDKIFKGQLAAIIKELNTYLYEDGGRPA